MGGQGWDANVGVRVIRTEQTASGNILGGPAPTNESPFGDYTPLTVKSAYTDVLPSVNLRVNVTDDLVARFAAGRTVARANFAQIAPGINLNGRSEEHTSELQSLMRISYAVFCLKKKTT